jgi:hypothetical protein
LLNKNKSDIILKSKNFLSKQDHLCTSMLEKQTHPPRAWFQRHLCSLHRACEARPYLYQIVQCQIDRSHREREGNGATPRLARWWLVRCCFSAGARGAGRPCNACARDERRQLFHTRWCSAVRADWGLLLVLAWHAPASACRVCPEISQCRSWPYALHCIGSIDRPEHVVLVYRCTFTVHAHTPGPGYYYCSITVLDRLEYICAAQSPLDLDGLHPGHTIMLQFYFSSIPFCS